MSRHRLATLLLAGSLLLLSACGEEAASGPALNPFGADDGKADGVGGGTSFYAPGQVHALMLTDVGLAGRLLTLSAAPQALPVKGDARLVVKGPKGTGSFRKFEVTGWRAAGNQRASLRLKLRKDDTVAGQRKLALVPMDGDSTHLRALLASQLGQLTSALVPRVVHARLSVDGIDLGLYLVVEHPDQSFLDRHFGKEASEGRVVRSDEPLLGDDVDLLAARLQVLPYAGTRALGSVLDLEATTGLLAVLAALGEPVNHGAPGAGVGPVVHLANPCGEAAPCFSPLLNPASVGSSGAPLSSDRRQLVAELRERVLRLPALRAQYLSQLQILVDCLGEAACSRDPLAKALGAISPALGPAASAAATQALNEDLLGPLDARAAELRALLERERTADAPDGHADYASFSRDDDGVLTVRFRHLTPGVHAAAVSLLWRAGRGAARELPLERDQAANLWSARLDEATAAAPFSYRFAVDGSDGARRMVSDPARRAPFRAGDEQLLDPAEVDELTLVDRIKLDVAEPSDLVMAGGFLYTVSDRNPNIYRLDPETGARLEKIDVPGRDLEALAIDPLSGEFLLADESRDHLWRLDASGEQLDKIDVKDVEDGNSGIEGLAVRHEDGHIFVGKEKQPDRMVELDAEGKRLRKVSVGFASDLSALTHAEAEDRLYALSQEDRTLFRLGSDLRAERSWSLDIKGAEGVVVSGGRVYVVSDDESRLYIYDLNAWRYR